MAITTGKISIFILSFLLLTASGLICAGEGSKNSKTYTKLLHKKDVIRTGLQFSGMPYTASTLDKNREEELVIHFDKYDCVTFVETTFSLYFDSQSETPSFENYRTILQNLRYRNGRIEGYTSRLHYFAEWILQNRQTYFSDITEELGGGKKKINFSFMSSHAHYYPLLNSKEKIAAIEKSEQDLSRQTFFVLPQEKIAQTESRIPDGSLIAFVGNHDDILIEHTGIAVHRKDGVKLLHASSQIKQVTVTEETLDAYVKKRNHFTGIIILIPRDSVTQ